ncbi:SMI1/KNR4 family protein [Bacillus sp. FSL W7-1360]
MAFAELERFIDVNQDMDDFTGGTDISEINSIEKELGCELPYSYKEFLKKYGSGGIFGVDILGCTKAEIPSVIVQTKRYRELGMPSHLVVVEDAGEYVYSLNTKSFHGEECPVIVWDRSLGLDNESEAQSFDEFLLRRLTEAKENWDEDF